MNTGIYLWCLSFPSSTLPPKLLSVFSSPHWRSHPLPFSCWSLALILSPCLFPSSYSSVSASPPTTLSDVELWSPHPLIGPASEMPRVSLSVFFLCLPASHWLTSSGGFLSLHLSLSLFLLPPPTPPTLRCAASYPRSFFLPLPLTALTPFLYFPLLSPSLSLLTVTPLLSKSPLSSLSAIFSTLSLPLCPSCHSFLSPIPPPLCQGEILNLC